MDRLRILSLVVVCALGGCRENLVSGSDGELLVQPARVDFGQRWVGYRGTRTLELQNTARMAMDVTLELTAPFDAMASVRVGGGDRLEVELGVTAAQLGVTEGTLLVSANGVTQTVPLRADAVQPPTCEVRDCRTVVFNPVTGACDEALSADGAGCGATNQCISNGVCMAGQCVGEARDCNDGNTCTSDACVAATGCVHEAVVCPSSLRACEVPICVPETGCGFAPAVDGVSCGSNDCVTAQVCISGQCVARPSPDGSQCSPATSCRGPGTCHQQACVLPEPTQLQPAWRYAAEDGNTLIFSGAVDDFGNLYATEVGRNVRNANGNNDNSGSGPGGTQQAGVPAFDGEDRNSIPIPTYLVSLTPSGALRFKVTIVTDCAACEFGISYAIDSAGHRIFFNAKGATQARSTDDGHPLWSTDPTAGLPAFDLRSDGGAAFYTSPPMLVGTDGVGIPVMEGNQDHHAYVQVFDRASGSFRWQFHRKGHTYGTGVTSSGELWTSSANCWAPAGEMARVNGAGQTQSLKFVPWIPSIYGDAVAIGTASGSMHSLNSTLDLTDLSTITTAGPGSVPLITGQQLMLFDGAARVLTSVNLTSGATAYSYNGVIGNAVDFELLRDGGVAWTAQIPDAGVLGAINSRGEEVLHCPLATTVESATAIIRGKAYVFSQGEIVAYDVPGLDVETSGWVSRYGSLQRAYRAR